MADLHPTELGDAFQEGSALRVAHEARPAETRPTEPRSAEPRPTALPKDVFDLLQPKQMRAHVRRLYHVVHHLRRVENLVNAHFADQTARRRGEGPQPVSQVPPHPEIPPLPPEGGEFRLFYVSPAGLQFERECLQDPAVTSITDLLHQSASILHSYCGLIRNSGMGSTEMDCVLSSMADVLQVALNAVNSAEQLCEILKPVNFPSQQSTN